MVPAQEASLKVNDLAILRGFGIFDYFLFKEGVPLFINDYLNRFYTSAEKLNLVIPFSKEDLHQQILALIAHNGVSSGAIRLVLTGGYTEDSYTPTRPNLLILQHESKPVAPKHFERGMKLMAVNYQRDLPEVKSINYAKGIQLIPQLKAIGAEEPLYHQNGIISEAVRSNFFIITSDNTIITAKTDILFGITRKHVLEACKEDFKIELRNFSLEEAYAAEEAFLTGSNKGVVPVSSIDEHLIGKGKAGEKVKKVIQLFDAYRSNYVKAHLAAVI